MREVRGFVFWDTREAGGLFGKAIHLWDGQDHGEQISTNGLTLFGTEAEAKRASAFHCGGTYISPKVVKVLRMELAIAETEEEIIKLASSEEGEFILLGLWEESGKIQYQLFGPGETATGSQIIMGGNLEFYRTDGFQEEEDYSFKDHILYRAQQINRQYQMAVNLAKIQIEEI